ncbi:arginine--tRNA ligase [Sandaracinobacter sp. RS1-74]|uniref:arginine--tRNA ligase n=1 Tax=Sandaracinobacteroides sayramensis TaxID=2913411 RepID=UPI001EDA52BD|nr:arginine--tRNA ligase [Sandaracinobacteroides sayramensis]MCG2840250.1 arginine--tRNA ligase [Sandaracinobacteroides sayramensis]
MDVFQRFEAVVADQVAALVAEGTIPAEAAGAAIVLEPPRDASHGDLATNAALALAKPARMNPRELATLIGLKLARHPEIATAEVAGPGFINLTLEEGVWRSELARILSEGPDYGRGEAAIETLPVNVEYVSANPTGPMHMGHCRGAVVGDALASLLAFAGHQVTREYYVNDAGGQVDVLARSAHLRYREALGEAIEIPEGLYPGDYLQPVGKALAAEFGDRYAAAPESEWLVPFRARAVAAMMEMIRGDLALLGIHHDIFSSEAALLASGAPQRAEAELRARDLIYDGVLPPPKGETPDDWEPVELPLFRSTAYGDDIDRPIRKSNGQWTYFGNDMAYHAEKARRSSALVNIWGADHAGTVKRIEAAVEALTHGEKRLDVKLVQMVRLFRGGEPVKMSKRAGNFVTLADVVREVGRDVVRFMMLTKRPEAMLDFDFAHVVEQSRENPVFYVHYAHARISSVLRKASELALPVPELSRLDADELGLAKLAAQWPRLVRQAAAAREPHRIAFYLADLAGGFHSLWNRGNDDPAFRLLREDDPQLTAARLELARAVAQVIRTALSVMGVTAAEELR